MIQRKRRKIDNQPTRHYSKEQEKAVAKTLGGKRQPNSGATMFAKGDVRIDSSSMLIECKTKTSSAESFSIKKSWIEKNATEALFIGKPYNALAFSFGPNEKNYYVIDEELMQILIEKLEQDL